MLMGRQTWITVQLRAEHLSEEEHEEDKDEVAKQTCDAFDELQEPAG